MEIKQFEIWIADLNPRFGSESGKKRPVLIIQTNLLNKIPHPSCIVLPITSNIQQDSEILRVHLEGEETGLLKASDVMIDQIRAIDNRRLLERVGFVPDRFRDQVKENIRIVLDLE